MTETTVNWGEVGVFWTGVPGDDIECLDHADTEEEEAGIARLRAAYGDDAGDMAAALVVARESDFRWIVYDHDGDRWTVTAYDDVDQALGATVSIESTIASFGGESRTYVFDGRTETMQDAPDGNGYVPPVGRQWVIDTTKEK